MKRANYFFLLGLSLLVVLNTTSDVRAQIDLGNFTVSGSAEINALPRGLQGDESRFQVYRDIPESVVVPHLELMIGSKKQDFFLDFDATAVGRDDQNYRLRFGRYGLYDVELEWDQIPHTFNTDTARTPYIMKGGTYTLRSRPTALDGTTFSNWINDPSNTESVDLDLLNKVGKISLRYTPNPVWQFTGKYWQQKTDGKRAMSFPFGDGSGANVAELAQPIDYRTHNIEFGGEYATKSWSLGLKYNGSIFHNSVSTLVFDNPARAGPGCTDSPAITYGGAGTGPCRGRVDLYPSNQAHTFTLTGTASLPLKTRFLGTVSYGWRFQDDSFLPFTINSAIAQPTLSRSNLDGDVRPTMVNLTLVNNLVDRLNLKAYYRLYDLDNRSKSVTTSGIVLNDQDDDGGVPWVTTRPYKYSKNSAGFGASYRFARWLTGRLDFGYERTHRRLSTTIDELHTTSLNSDEYKIGPKFDIKPLSWLLVRASYQHSWRFDPGYHSPTNPNRSSDFEMFWLTKRNQDKVSLFADISPWDKVSFHAGFDYVQNNYPDVDRRLHNTKNYSPSVGVFYTPAEWLRLFADYNFDHYSWNQKYNDDRRNHGKDMVHTFTLGSDMDLIKDLLGFRIQYGFSQGLSKITNKNGANSDDPEWPDNTNTWHELLARFEYRLHKNVAVQLGYYFNRFHSKDYGVDIMKLWMGDFDTTAGQQRSVYLGDRFKGSYTAHVGVLGLKFKF